MKRNRIIDIAKGIGIVLVMLAHSRFANCGFREHWITSFHMPLFFVMAGYCFDSTRYKTLWDYCKRKCVALVYPYFTLSAVVMGLTMAFYYGTDISVVKEFRWMLAGATTGPMWFIRVLLMTELIYAILVRVVRNAWARMVSCCLLCVIGVTLSGYPLWKADVALVSMFFYGIGHFVRKFTDDKGGVIPHEFLVLGGGGIALIAHTAAVVFVAPYSVMYGANHLGNLLYFFPIALFGIYGLTFVSTMIDRFGTKFRVADFIAYLGKNSIILLVLHPVLGDCRKSWVELGLGGVVSQIIELMLLGFFFWLIAGCFRFIIVPSKGK